MEKLTEELSREREREAWEQMKELDLLERKRVVAMKLSHEDECFYGGPPSIPHTWGNGKNIPTGTCEQFVCDCGGEVFKAFYVNECEGDIRCEKCGRWHILHDG